METRVKNPTSPLLGETSTGSERPESNPNAEAGPTKDPPKTRVRYSGAARRRYKKLLKEGGVASPASPPSLSKPTEGGRDAPTRADKRSRPEQTTPGSADRQGKKPKVTDQGSYAQAARGTIKLAIIPDNYPEIKLGAEDVALIRKLIRKRILELPANTRAPTFAGSWERDGALVFSCADEPTGDWLKSLPPELAVGDKPLRVLPADELPKRHRAVVHVEEPGMSAEEALKLLDRQNKDLRAGEWVVAKGSESSGASSSHFACLIGDSSLEALRSCNFRPFCGTVRAVVKLVEREPKEGTEDKSGAKGGAGLVD